MRSVTQRRLATAATVLDGLIAGASLNRSVVELPALRRLGAAAWARYSQNADLRNGRIWYPALAILGAACTVGAAVGRRSLWPAAILSAAGLLATIEAGPNVLRVRRAADLPTVERSFVRFRRWHALRAVLQAAGFVFIARRR